MADRIVMGYWDCPYCGTNKIKGTLHDCPNCGRQRGKEVRFYMDASNKEYLSDHKVDGADWYCDYCGALNKASLMVCENCASPREESKQDYFSFNKDRQNRRMTDVEASDKIRPKYDSNDAIHKYNNDREKQTSTSTSNEKHSSVSTSSERLSSFNSNTNVWQNMNKYINIKRVGIMLAIPLFILLLVLIFKPRTNVMTVTDVKWTNTITIEELKTFNEDDWSLPHGARLKYTRSEIREYESVIDHYETVTKSRQVQDGGHYEYDYSDNGDGTFTEHSHFVPEYKTEYYEEQEPVYRQEPIYATKYYYEIDRWVFGRNVVTSGSDKSPYWGDVNLSNKERESNRNTKYTIIGTIKKNKKEKTVSYDVDSSTWEQLNAPVVIEITTVAGTLKEWKFVNNSVD